MIAFYLFSIYIIFLTQMENSGVVHMLKNNKKDGKWTVLDNEVN